MPLSNKVLSDVFFPLAPDTAFVAYFVLGGLFFAARPLRNEFAKFPAIYRTQESMKPTLPLGMASMLVAMIVLAVLYAMLYKGGSGLIEGARFGALIGLFCVCSFVIHNYVNLNIGFALTLYQGITYFIEWVIVGTTIGILYKPS